VIEDARDNRTNGNFLGKKVMGAIMTLFPDRDSLRRQFMSAKPFPYIKIDSFIDPTFAKEVAAAYPPFDEALKSGKSFKAVNERKKVQISKAAIFAPPIARLNDMLAAPDFMDDLSFVTGIPKLLADEELNGGGIHMTGPGGRLDVHVDFNFLEERSLHRRLNLLLYLNNDWPEAWGGQIQLWDQNVKHCIEEFAPKFNRCVIFETNEISYHGVVPISPNATAPRISFATYYYTKEAPEHWTGHSHSTIFKARPNEVVRKMVLMPGAQIREQAISGARRLKRLLAGNREP
jgi:hypothetical protein